MLLKLRKTDLTVFTKIKLQEPLSVANYVISYANQQNHPVTNLHLQKILFFLQGYFLAQHHKPLMNCTFVKWEYGPVLPDIYQIFKYNDINPIQQLGTEVYGNASNIYAITPMIDRDVIDYDLAINNLLDILIQMGAIKLIALTQKHSSWLKYEKLLRHNQKMKYSEKETKLCFIDNKAQLK